MWFLAPRIIDWASVQRLNSAAPKDIGATEPDDDDGGKNGDGDGDHSHHHDVNVGLPMLSCYRYAPVQW